MPTKLEQRMPAAKAQHATGDTLGMILPLLLQAGDLKLISSLYRRRAAGSGKESSAKPATLV